MAGDGVRSNRTLERLTSPTADRPDGIRHGSGDDGRRYPAGDEQETGSVGALDPNELRITKNKQRYRRVARWMR